MGTGEPLTTMWHTLLSPTGTLVLYKDMYCPPLKAWRTQEGTSRQSCHLFTHVQPSRGCSAVPWTSTQPTYLYVISKEERSRNYPSTLANVGTLSRSPSTPKFFKECLG